MLTTYSIYILVTLLATLLATISAIPAPTPANSTPSQAAEVVISSPGAPAVYPSTPTPGVNPTDCDRGGLYLCASPSFGPPCTHLTLCLGSSDSSCYPLDGTAVSIGPDQGITCLFYKNGVCRDFGDGVLRLGFPGVEKVEEKYFGVQCFRS